MIAAARETSRLPLRDFQTARSIEAVHVGFSDSIEDSDARRSSPSPDVASRRNGGLFRLARIEREARQPVAVERTGDDRAVGIDGKRAAPAQIEDDEVETQLERASPREALRPRRAEFGGPADQRDIRRGDRPPIPPGRERDRRSPMRPEVHDRVRPCDVRRPSRAHTRRRGDRAARRCPPEADRTRSQDGACGWRWSRARADPRGVMRVDVDRRAKSMPASVSGSRSPAIATISPRSSTIWLFPQYATIPSSLPHLLAATNGTRFS